MHKTDIEYVYQSRVQMQEPISLVSEMCCPISTKILYYFELMKSYNIK